MDWIVEQRRFSDSSIDLMIKAFDRFNKALDCAIETKEGRNE